MPTGLRNDITQYDDLVDAWDDPRGVFAMLHWLAATRASYVPVAPRRGAVLLDVACGGGLLAPHVDGKGYRHIGVDLSASAVRVAARKRISVVRADAGHLPFADASADVVVAGEALEHVTDLPLVLGELCRVLRPGGLLVADTIANTALARLIVVTLAERIPGGAPKGIHDPALFVDRKQLVATAADHGVVLQLHGLRPSLTGWLRWSMGTLGAGRIVRTRPTSVLFVAHGRKAAA
ncbi:MAG: 2-polyprenyl-6-hydroxyphenyl methylase / 3-demethylubiquinone-9 3-methyltransferase [Frankiaceae bacterium]|nr:2-polyprenyl-6-hydroxyphenyl methylase / 3-demethylubiquinone-9 3-methyltransferase [Frankiaceae bacterium]